MPFQFTTWFWLLLLPPLYLFFVWLSRNTLSDLPPRRRRFALLVRCLLVTLLILALAGFQWVRRGHRLAVIFAIDSSRSIPVEDLEWAKQYLANAQKGMHAQDLAGLITFAREPHIQALPAHSFPTNYLQEPGPTDATNIADALREAKALLNSIPGNPGKRIVLLSDGDETNGNALGTLSELQANHILLDTVVLPHHLKQEALVERLALPSRVKIGEPFAVRAVVESLTTQPATLVLLRNGELAAPQKHVTLHPGKNLISFSQTILHPGTYRYTVTLNAPQDTFPENNRGEGLVWVRGKPTLLYVADSPALTGFLQQTLRKENIDVAYAPPQALPNDAASLEGFDSIFLSNVSATELSEAQMRALQTACRDFGIGLGMVGGDQSFGAGYYRHTPIEEALPVSMDIKKQKRLPSVAVALVIEDLEIPTTVNMSIEAAKAIVDLLEPIDQLGVLDCNGFYFGQSTQGQSPAGTWRIPMQHVTDPNAIKAQMQDLTNMGDPPSYIPFLLEAARVLNNTDAKIKHIIFLGDGDAIYEADQKQTVAAFKKVTSEGITVSTIATGADAMGKRYMEVMALLGHGQAYVADSPQELPRLLLKDQETISQPPIIEEPFDPTPVDTGGALKGIDWNSAPPLLGYDVVSLKPTATLGLLDASPGRNNPIFASWRYGLGRSVAFMSDDRARWAAQWLHWPGYAKFWAQTVRWTMRPSPAYDYDLQTTQENGVGHITLDAVDTQGRFVDNLKVRAHIVPPDNGSPTPPKPFDIPLRQTAPGHYEGTFDAPDTGTYAINVLYKTPNGSQLVSMPTDLVNAYPAEYRDLHANRYLLSRLAELGLGRFNPPAQAIFGADRPEEASPVDLTLPLLAAALLLLPVDIALRRLAIDAKELQRAWSWLRGRRKPAEDVESKRLSRLKKAKQAAFSEQPSTMQHAASKEAPPTPPVSRPSVVFSRPEEPTPQPLREEPTVLLKEPEEGEEIVSSKEEMGGLSRLMAAKRRARSQVEPPTETRDDLNPPNSA
ncbi:MAG TPA: glutamine amidotransferase [Chthonomonas sp.]|uniref:glutamine amidotransferase n=1 Tax=Chthonomonas sp. TaxID=2282153 RepID=UPI002B4AD59B|nr:glutamine amidotransferase [Chthonomonas sp.]HLI47984.1 glutamine amidotransferase [Chthonomonas sp.]